jgi:hypothetical protein
MVTIKSAARLILWILQVVMAEYWHRVMGSFIKAAYVMAVG